MKFAEKSLSIQHSHGKISKVKRTKRSEEVEDDSKCSFSAFSSPAFSSSRPLRPLNCWQDIPSILRVSFPFLLLRASFLFRFVSRFEFFVGARARGSLVGLAYTHRCNFATAAAPRFAARRLLMGVL